MTDDEKWWNGKIKLLIAIATPALAALGLWINYLAKTEYNFPRSGEAIVGASPYAHSDAGPHTQALDDLAQFLRDKEGHRVYLRLSLANAIQVEPSDDPLKQVLPGNNLAFYLVQGADDPYCADASNSCPNGILLWAKNRNFYTVRIDGFIATFGDAIAVENNEEAGTHVTAEGKYIRLRGYFLDEGPVGYQGGRLTFTPFVLRPLPAK